jgi:VWFA-related protein
VNLVLIPVLVTDLYDRPVQGLHKEDFRLLEDGAEQSISQFFSDDSPISIGVVFDASNSMRSKIGQSRQAVSEFLRMSTPGDEFFLLKFNDRPELLHAFTRDVKAIEEAVESIQAIGWTSLYDAIYMSINRMKHASHARKVLLVLSDGGDNNSRYTESEVRELVKEADVRIFSISILDKSTTLEKISDESGGRAYRVKNLDELPDLAANVSIEMHSQYVLGYSPVNQNDGKYRKVKVELTAKAEKPRSRISWKRGYYGPAQ